MKLFEEISEHGIFHDISNLQENKLLKRKDKKGLFTIEWNDSAFGTGWHLPASNNT